MDKRIGICVLNDIKIFKIDLSYLKGEDLIEHAMYTAIRVKEIDEDLNFLIDLRDCDFNFETLSFLKEAGKDVQKYVLKSAILGVSNRIKPFFNIYMKYTGSKIKTLDSDKSVEYYFAQV